MRCTGPTGAEEAACEETGSDVGSDAIDSTVDDIGSADIGEDAVELFDSEDKSANCEEDGTEDKIEDIASEDDEVVVLGTDMETETAACEEDGVCTGMQEQPGETTVSKKTTKIAAIRFFPIVISIKEKA